MSLMKKVTPQTKLIIVRPRIKTKKDVGLMLKNREISVSGMKTKIKIMFQITNKTYRKNLKLNVSLLRVIMKDVKTKQQERMEGVT